MRISQIQQRLLQLRGRSMIREAYLEWMNRSPSVRELRYWRRNLSRKHQTQLLQRLILSSKVRRFVTQEQPTPSVIHPTRIVHRLYHLFRRSADDFVIGLYEEFLHRTPQSGELQGYLNLLRSSDDYWTVFEMIALSPEAQAIWEQQDQSWTVSDLLHLAFTEDGVGFVQRLTRELLARDPLRAEMKRFRGSSASPEDKEKVLTALLYSNEFRHAIRQRRLPSGRVASGLAIGRLRKLYRQGGIHFVTTLYRELLGREPDAQGAAIHLEMLRRTSKLELIRSVLLSPEADALRRGNEVDRIPINYPLAVSVIIPTMNQVEMLQQCVQSLRNATHNLQYEIIVVDDGSNPDIQEQLRAWGAHADIRLIAKPMNEGFSKTVNVGIGSARGEHILLLNNDVIFHEPGCLKKLVNVMNQAPDIGIVGARLLFRDGNIQHGGIVEWADGWFPHRYVGLPGDYVPAQITEDVLAVTGALMLLRHEMLDQIGLLSEDYQLSFEDIDICFRARYHGWRVLYCGEAAAIHLGGATRKNPNNSLFELFEQREANSFRVFQQRWKGINT